MKLNFYPYMRVARVLFSAEPLRILMVQMERRRVMVRIGTGPVVHLLCLPLGWVRVP